jgi:cyclopropane fatty-acyl-phospholipid synthase-like methyltransferase
MNSEYKIQVDKDDAYVSEYYLTSQRWSSYAVAIREIMELKPKRILEIGPGNGIVTGLLRSMGFEVKTLDFDARVKPDYVASVTDAQALAPLAGKFDLILACEIFEHIKYEDFIQAIQLLKSIAPKMIVSVPHTTVNSRFFHLAFKIPGIRRVSISKKWIYKKIEHEFNGQHHWELGKRGFSVVRICKDFNQIGWRIMKKFFNPENPYHYFFVLEQK